MALDNFAKQPYESFPIEAEFGNVLIEGEEIIAATSDVSALKSDGSTPATDIILTVAQKAVNAEGSALQIRVKDGVAVDSPYKITFRAVTDQDNYWEKDVEMSVEEL